MKESLYSYYIYLIIHNDLAMKGATGATEQTVLPQIVLLLPAVTVPYVKMEPIEPVRPIEPVEPVRPIEPIGSVSRIGPLGTIRPVRIHRASKANRTGKANKTERTDEGLIDFEI